jgi:hypothetical protein
MKYFIKFTGLPHCYAVVSSGNSKSALKKAQEFRKDSVVVNPTDRIFTFEDAHNFASYWTLVKLENVENKNTYEVYECNKDVKPGHGIVALEETMTVESINPDKVAEWCKRKTGNTRGVVWVRDATSGSLVFGDKKDNKARPLLVLNKIELKKLV